MLWMTIGQVWASSGVMDRVAAVVDDEVVLLSEVYEMGADFIEGRCSNPVGRERCVHDAEREVVDQLVKRALIKRELTKLDFTVSSADVDLALDGVVRDFGLADREALREEVQKAGLTWDAYRDQLKDQLQVQRFQQRVLAPRVNIADDELRDLYDRTARTQDSVAVVLDALGMALPPEPAARQNTLEQAAVLVGKLNDGTVAFQDARAQYDTAGIGAAVGDRAYKKGQLAPALDEVVFDAPANVVLDPIPVGSMLMIVRVRERQKLAGEVKPFEEVEPALRQQIFVERVEEAETEWTLRMLREVNVQYRLPEL